MSSSFDSSVHQRRNATPWAKMSLAAFLKDAAWNGAPTKADDQPRPASISVVYRGDVASRMWWSIIWTGEDGELHEASAQDLDLALWRAAETELASRGRAKDKATPKG